MRAWLRWLWARTVWGRLAALEATVYHDRPHQVYPCLEDQVRDLDILVHRLSQMTCRSGMALKHVRMPQERRTDAGLHPTTPEGVRRL